MEDKTHTNNTSKTRRTVRSSQNKSSTSKERNNKIYNENASQPPICRVPQGEVESIQNTENKITPAEENTLAQNTPELQAQNQNQNESAQTTINNNSNRENKGKHLFLSDLQKMSVPTLCKIAEGFGIIDIGTLRRHELIFEILKANARQNGTMSGKGVLEILPDGFGFLRSPYYNYLPCPEDIYISPSQIRRFALRTGDQIEGEIRAPKDKERFFAMLRVDKINGKDPSALDHKIPFENLTPLFPNRRIILERESSEISMRVMDIFTPIGMG